MYVGESVTSLDTAPRETALGLFLLPEMLFQLEK